MKWINYAVGLLVAVTISCKGPEGKIGPAGHNSISNIGIEPSGANCAGGGTKIDSGIDKNDDGVLSSDEITLTKYVCGPLDKQTRLEIGGPNFGTNTTTFLLSQYQTYHLIKFNKLNYTNVDSITFVPSVYTPVSTNHAYLDLYDVTDNATIANSQVQSTTTDYVFVESRNIYKDLPNKEITLGLRIRTENSNYSVTTGIRSFVFIYKH